MSEEKQHNDASDNDEFKVNVRRESSSEERTDEEIFDEVVAENDDDVKEDNHEDEQKEDAPEPVHHVVPGEHEDTSKVDEKPVEKEEVVEQKPVAAAPVVEAKPKTGNSPGVLVLQWVTYAFWMWFGVSMLWLAGVVTNFFVAGTKTTGIGEEIAYPLASVIVMLLCAAVADLFYAKHEPQHKTGGSMVIMLIHAVLFIMATVGSLVAAVFALITILINNDPLTEQDGTKVALAVSVVGVLLFGTLTLRVLMAGKHVHVRAAYWVFAGLMAAGFIAACVAGPVNEANATKNDRLIESALPDLARDINTYAGKNDKLPAKLSDVPATSAYNPSNKQRVQAMIDKGLVTYKPNTKPSQDDTDNGIKPLAYETGATKVFYYQLCTTYAREKGNLGNYRDAETNDIALGGASYSSSYSYVDTSTHPKGDKCYNLSASGKYNYYYDDAVRGSAAGTTGSTGVSSTTKQN